MGMRGGQRQDVLLKKMGQQGRSAMRWCERGREGADVTEQKSIALELST